MATPKIQKRRILISGCLFHIYHDSIADGLAVLLPLWQAAFQLSLTQVGLVITCFEGATALFQMPAGLLGERFGERRLLTLGTLLAAACFIAVAMVGNVYALCILMVVGGLGASVQHPLAAAMISKAYARDNQRIVLGTYNFTGDMGKFMFPAVAAVRHAKRCQGGAFYGSHHGRHRPRHPAPGLPFIQGNEDGSPRRPC